MVLLYYYIKPQQLMLIYKRQTNIFAITQKVVTLSSPISANQQYY